MNACASILDQIKDQMVGQFTVETVDGACFLITPFLLPDNTPISFELIVEPDEAITVTDYGQASDYAFVHGVGGGSIDSRLKFVQSRFNADLDHGVLSKTVHPEQVAATVIELISGVQDIGYLIYKRQGRHKRETFKIDVESFLGSQGRSFLKNRVLPGQTGERTFDYLVRGDHTQLALSLFESASTPGAESRAKKLVFDYLDVRNRGLERIELAVLLDTRVGKPRDEVVSILENYVPNVVRWDERHRIEDLLAA